MHSARVTPDERARDSPTGSVGEHDVALLARPLDKRHARVPLPVPHGLPEYCPLGACKVEAICQSTCGSSKA